MKNTLLFILCLSCTSVFAKDRFFLQPAMGVGLGNVKGGFPSSQNATSALVHSEIIGVGYSFGHIVAGSGVGYARTGSAEKFQFTDALGNVIGNGTSALYVNQVILPLTIGYQFALGKKFFVAPTAGAEVTYNYSETSVVWGYGSRRPITSAGSNFKNGCKPVSAFALVQVNFELALTGKLGIVFGPKADYMFTNMSKNTNGFSLHGYSVMLDAGVKWRL